MGPIKMFCFAHAGGSASSYINWIDEIGETIEILPVELNGHGEFFDKKSYNDFSELLEELYGRIIEQIDIKTKYSMFGHSMGAYIVYLLECMIEQNTNLRAEKIFVSGMEAPKFWIKNIVKISCLTNEEFINQVISFGGIPEEILKNDELKNVFFPILKNDFRLIESLSNYEINNEEVECDIVTLNGEDDVIEKDEIFAWSEYTSKNFYLKFFHGDHFYIAKNKKEIIQYIRQLFGK